MIGTQAIEEEEGFDVGSVDGFPNLADDWEQAGWSVVAGICFCTFLCREEMLVLFTLTFAQAGHLTSAWKSPEREGLQEQQSRFLRRVRSCCLDRLQNLS